MITWGISANSHNAAVAVFADEKLVFASETERWSKIKNDPNLDQGLKNYLFDRNLAPDKVIWYERPFIKTLRQLEAGQGWNWKENNVKTFLKNNLYDVPVEYVGHHKSHAAAGFYTSPFDEACVLVIDSIGEYNTLSIWEGKGDKLSKRFTLDYPHSIGLWYSAMTQRVGLTPNEEEYILMGMAAYGDPNRLYKDILNDFIGFPTSDMGGFLYFRKNLHKGCKDWRPDLTSEQDMFDIAAATQAVYEMLFERALQYARQMVSSKNIVLMGGCALNCSANPVAYKYFDNVWIYPNPGDAGSAIGAVLAKKPHWREYTDWTNPYLGLDIPTKHNNSKILHFLLTRGICGVARGRAEFGPRALGNRSLLADPRSKDIKERVNDIKQRQQFRPFAPAILAELANHYFDIPGGGSPYMQLVARCRHPELFPAIVHRDGTSRVQTVTRDSNPEFYELLKMWYKTTGCPMLLNTSLNIRGKPMVNTTDDALEFQNTYRIKVFS